MGMELDPLDENVYKLFLNINYYLILIPFRIHSVKLTNRFGDDEYRYKICSNPFQKIVCTSLVLLDILQGFFLAQGAYWGKIKKEPSVLFLIWFTLQNGLFLGIIWLSTFWRKCKFINFIRLSHLLDLDQLDRSELDHHHNQSLSKKLKTSVSSFDQNDQNNDVPTGSNLNFASVSTSFLVLCLGLLIPVGMELLQILNVDGPPINPPTNNSHISDSFRISSAQPLYDLLLHKNHTHISEDKFTDSYYTISIFYIGLRTYGKVILGMAHVLSLLGAYTVYIEIKRVSKLSMRGDLEVDSGQRRVLLARYLRLGKLITLVNKVCRPFVLCLVSASVPLFVLRLIFAWDSDQISVKVVVFFKLTIYMAIVLLCAEANHEGTLLKTKMLELNHISKEEFGSGGTIFRDELGMDVGPFVKISFAFLGSMFSAYLSYTIMLLQIVPVSDCTCP